jgi:hypothetical protein
MNKRRPALDARQIGFTFDPPSAPAKIAGLAGLGMRVSAAVGHAIKDDLRSRAEIAGAMSALLGDDEVSRWMLDAWSAESKDQHSISVARFLALVTVTNRHDLLDALVREIGVAVLVGAEINTARLGDIDRRIAELKAEKKRISDVSPVIRGVR